MLPLELSDFYAFLYNKNKSNVYCIYTTVTNAKNPHIQIHQNKVLQNIFMLYSICLDM